MKSQHNSPDQAGLRIVLACESPGFDGRLRSELEMLGHDVSEVTSAAEAMAQLGAESIDVVVTNLEMTKSFALMEFCRSLRRDCKSVVATTWGQILSNPDICLGGADFVIPSSCDAEDLLAEINPGRKLS